MGWRDNLNRDSAEEMEDLAYAPSGGRCKMIVWGVVLSILLGLGGCGAAAYNELVM